ncbi:hypothetical protein CBS101457_006371 [Exobasidium rhododendri]|nr:hypothetical protein CBS101457_006371 [Exobasidium rhododendri]
MQIDLQQSDTLRKVMAALPKDNVGLGMAASAACLVAWEYLCTLPLSIRYLISKRSRATKILFLTNRYMGVYTSIVFVLIGSKSANKHSCSFLVFSADVAWAAISLNAIFVLLRRTYCISNLSRKVLYIILPFALFLAASVIAVVSHATPLWVDGADICLTAAVSALDPLLLRILMTASALFDAVILAVTVYKLRKLVQPQETKAPFLYMLEAHSLFYYIFIATFDLIVFTVSFIKPAFIASLAPFAPAVLTVTIQRILLEDIDFSTRNEMQQIRQKTRQSKCPVVDSGSANASPSIGRNEMTLECRENVARLWSSGPTTTVNAVPDVQGEKSVERSTYSRTESCQSGWKAFRNPFLPQKDAHMIGMHDLDRDKSTAVLVELDSDKQRCSSVETSFPPALAHCTL